MQDMGAAVQDTRDVGLKRGSEWQRVPEACVFTIGLIGVLIFMWLAEPGSEMNLL